VRRQCRQKTVEVKAKCGSCTLYWCPRCLLNRYGEEVEAVRARSAARRGPCRARPPSGVRARRSTSCRAGAARAAAATATAATAGRCGRARGPSAAHRRAVTCLRIWSVTTAGGHTRLPPRRRSAAWRPRASWPACPRPRASAPCRRCWSPTPMPSGRPPRLPAPRTPRWPPVLRCPARGRLKGRHDQWCAAEKPAKVAKRAAAGPGAARGAGAAGAPQLVDDADLPPRAPMVRRLTQPAAVCRTPSMLTPHAAGPRRRRVPHAAAGGP